jgi:hypothetical protein
LASTATDLPPGEPDHEVGAAGLDDHLFVEVHVPKHAGGLHDAAQLDLAPGAAPAVVAQGGRKGGGGAQQFGVVPRGRLQLLVELGVLVHPVPLQNLNRALHVGEALSHRAQRPQDGLVPSPAGLLTALRGLERLGARLRGGRLLSRRRGGVARLTQRTVAMHRTKDQRAQYAEAGTDDQQEDCPENGCEGHGSRVPPGSDGLDQAEPDWLRPTAWRPRLPHE